MPRAFTPQEKEIIRARLLEHGFRIFSAYGLKKTSVEDLTRAAGISKGAFYLFYNSKEELFMEVMEKVEDEFRSQVLAELDQPGSSPVERLRDVFHKAFALWKTFPILQSAGLVDYDLLMRGLSAERLEAHLRSDRDFLQRFVDRCRQTGIPLQAEPQKISYLMNALFFVSLHEKDFGPEVYHGTIDLLIDLVTSYCLSGKTE